MEGENNKKLVETFLEITSSSNEEALFFLESHNWDLDSAVSTFLEDNSFNTDTTTNNHPPSHSPSPSPLITSDFRSTEAMDSSDKKPSKPSGSRTGRIRTFSDLNRQSDSESDNDSDELKEYFTGGEKSGMLVQDPSKGNDVDAIFNQARQLGAVERPADQLGPSSISRSFTGTGRLLSGETVPSAPQPSEPMIHNIIFWANGFTVNDGPLRRLDNPENEPFLESIMKSECPKELEPVDRSKPVPVHVNIIRRDVDCPEPEKRQVPFQGVGITLGSGTTTTTAPTITTVAPEPSVTVGSLNTTSSPSMGLIVDETLPSTSIQLRLSDGTRMVARFNYHHSISDIRAFIDASRPGGVRTYRLQTVGFPPKQLTDVNQTIEQAGLANSVVIQNL